MKRNRKRTHRTPPGGKEIPPKTSSDPSPVRKRWLFRLAALTVVPLIGLGAVEGALRLGGFGYPTSFFLPWTIAGQKVLVENEKFSRQFFPPGLARRPLPLSLSLEKPADTFRIFVFGESAAMGDPEPAYSFGRILGVLLRERFPGTRFEVINVAFTAINSHVLLPIARECARQKGDLWIVYMGNNEVMGPFGAGTIFGAQSPPLAVIRTSLALKRLKLGQLADQTLDRLFQSNSRTQSWAGMEMFLQQQIRRDDPRLSRVEEHFRENLADILRLGIRSGAKAIVSTVADNLRDCAPLASLHAATLTADQITQWNQGYHEAGMLEAGRQYVQAIDRYLATERIDSSYAELQFRLGRCYDAVTNSVEARRRFVLARDLDTLRFRTDSRLNQVIKQVSAGRTGEGIHLVDAAESMAQASPDGIPGEAFFFDHVHLTFEGNYRLARVLAEQAVHALPARITHKDRGNWASADVCSSRLALTGWNQYQMYESMQSRIREAPFTNQLNHVIRQIRYRTKLAELRPALQPAALQQAAQVYRQALALDPGDALLEENFARLLNAAGDQAGALTHFQRVTELWPHHSTGLYNLGHILLSEGKAGEAERYFRQALALSPDYSEALNGLGSVFVSQGKTPQAMEYFSQALQLKPTLWEAHLNLGLLADKQGHSNQAAARYAEALRLNPNSIVAHLHLGELLAREGDVMEAMKHNCEAVKLQPDAGLARFKENARLRPNDPMARFNLANALAVVGQQSEALENLREAVRLQPGFWEARYLLGVELATRQTLAEAEEQFLEVTRLRPEFALAHLNLGVALVKESRVAKAMEQFRETLQLQPANAAARQYLRMLQALTNSVR